MWVSGAVQFQSAQATQKRCALLLARILGDTEPSARECRALWRPMAPNGTVRLTGKVQPKSAEALADQPVKRTLVLVCGSRLQGPAKIFHPKGAAGMEDMLRYLDEIVEPAVKEFEDHPTSRRHAFVACVLTFHSIDYLAYPRKRPSALRQQFGRQSPEFRIVDQVAHAFKHVTTGKRSNPDLRAHEVVSRPPSFCDVMVVGLSRLGDARGGVTLYKDHSVDLLRAVKGAIAFLRAQANDATNVERAIVRGMVVV